MRKLLSIWLQSVAKTLYNEEHKEQVSVIDEYGVCRCRVEVVADSCHYINTTIERLPAGWLLQESGMECH